MSEILISKWPDLVISMVGVVIGGLITITVAWWQVNRQNKELKSREEEMLAAYFPRVILEFRDNLHTIGMLEEVLSQTESARLDVWVWANAVVESFSLVAYDEMVKMGLQRHLPKGIEKDLFHSNRMLIGLSDMVKQGVVRHEFLLGYKADTIAANDVLKNCLTYCRTVKERFKYFAGPFSQYKETLIYK